MKKHLFFSIILFALLSSCIKDYETMTFFHVKNVSNHNVDLILFNTDLELFGYYKDTTIMLPINSEFSFKTFVRGEDSPSHFPFGSSTDSVIIKFDDDVSITYRQPLRFTNGGNRNILSRDSYTGGRKSNNLYEYYYSITEQDYLDAIGKK